MQQKIQVNFIKARDEVHGRVRPTSTFIYGLGPLRTGIAPSRVACTNPEGLPLILSNILHLRKMEFRITRSHLPVQRLLLFLINTLMSPRRSEAEKERRGRKEREADEGATRYNQS